MGGLKLQGPLYIVLFNTDKISTVELINLPVLNAFKLVIEWNTKVTHEPSFLQAYSTMEEMRNKIPRVNMPFYVDMKTIQAVHKALDIPLKDQERNGNGFRLGGQGEEEEDGVEMEEEVLEDLPED